MTHYHSTNEYYYDYLEEYHFDSPSAVELAQRAAKVFRRAYEFEEEETTVMDFACGVGLVSRELIPHAKSIVGVDISQRMVDEYNRRVANQGISVEEMYALRADILSSSSGELYGMQESFNVIVCAASYHHFDDIRTITQALSKYLKPGGTLLVLDLLKDDNLVVDEVFPEHNVHDIVAHQGGFARHQIEEAFDAAGFLSFTFNDGIKAKKKGYPVTLFIARGVKPFVAS